MEAICGDKIITISSYKFNLIKDVYKFHKKHYLTYEIKKIQLRYAFNKEDCNIILIFEIITNIDSFYYYNDNGNVCLSNKPKDGKILNGVLIKEIDVIISKHYDYLANNLYYNIFNPTSSLYMEIDVKSEIGKKIKNIYLNINNHNNCLTTVAKSYCVKLEDFYNNYKLEILIFNSDVLIKLKCGNIIKYIGEDLICNDNMPEIFNKNESNIKSYILNTHPYEQFNI